MASVKKQLIMCGLILTGFITWSCWPEPTKEQKAVIHQERMNTVPLIEQDGKWRSLIGMTKPVTFGGIACVFNEKPTPSGSRIQGKFDHEEDAELNGQRVRMFIFSDCKIVE